MMWCMRWRGSRIPIRNRAGCLAGSGNQGHLYRIFLDGTYADLAHLEATEATAFAMSDNNLYVATSNTGKLYRLSASSAGSGDNSTYVSPVADAKFSSILGSASGTRQRPLRPVRSRRKY